MKKVVLCLVSICCAMCLFGTDNVMISPNEKFSVEIQQTDKHNSFHVMMEDRYVVSLKLGLLFTDSQFMLTSGESIYVESIECGDLYNEYIVSKDNEKMQVRFRMFDNALAFRYENTSIEPDHINRELSSWTLPSETITWYFERKNAWKLKSYAGTWEKTPLSDLCNVADSPIQGTPLVFKFSFGKYGFISEAALENYSGMRLEADSMNTLTVNFTEGDNGFDVPAKFISPWRVFFVGDDLNALVNQSVIKDLSPKPNSDLYADMSYIIPGKCAWRWFSKGTGTPIQERQVIDEAAKMNFMYSLIDDGWKDWKNCWKEAEELVAYAKDKNVRLLFWQHSKPLRVVDNDYEDMRNFLDSIAFIGAAGVKVDFMDSEAKQLIDFEIKLLKECAKRQLVVNFHGCHAPSGEVYTYPNELTREGIRGIELNKMCEGYIPSYHNAALPFTRLMVGHGDYTPLTFTVPGETSFAHQLATLVCFNSPLQTIAEDPGLLLNEVHVNLAADFVRNVPTVWDEVRVLPQSEIGKLAVIAKRKGCDWYIGILNGEAIEKTINLNLDPYTGHLVFVEAYVDDLKSDKVLLSMEGHRQGGLRREPSIPFMIIKDLNALKTITVAAHGGAVLVIHN